LMLKLKILLLLKMGCENNGLLCGLETI